MTKKKKKKKTPKREEVADNSFFYAKTIAKLQEKKITLGTDKCIPDFVLSLSGLIGQLVMGGELLPRKRRKQTSL